jgi:hypothetical protein
MKLALILLAAGHGTRFGGPKQLVAVDEQGACIAERSIRDAAKAGFSCAVLVIRPEHRSTWEAKNWPIPVYFVGQDSANGTGHALRLGMLRALDLGCVAWAVGNGDDYYGSLWQSAKQRAEQGWIGALAYPLSAVCSPHGPVNRAILDRSNQGLLTGISEREGLTQADVAILGDPLVSMNAWIFNSDTLQWWPLVGTDSGEFGIPDAVRAGIAQGIPFRVDSLGTEWIGMTFAADQDHVWTYFERT